MTVLRRWRSQSSEARPLDVHSLGQVRQALTHDPVASCMVADHIATLGRHSTARCFLGIDQGRQGLCFVAGNVIPIVADPQGLRSFATVLAPARPQGGAILGRAELVLPLWQQLQPHWPHARDVRSNQPLLICPDPSAVTPNRSVRAVTIDEFDAYYPAAVAMFREEVGVDPGLRDQGRGYRRRIRDLITAQRAYAIFEGPRVVFKAEIGAISPTTALIQGVWIDPDLRGQGMAAAATAAVVEQVQRRGLLPSLYVNDYNAAARATYSRLGFVQIATFASVLF